MTYYEKNKHVRLNYQKAYYRDNMEEIKKYTKAYYELNKIQMKEKRKGKIPVKRKHTKMKCFPLFTQKLQLGLIDKRVLN